MNILVTGPCGFIGSHLVDHLLAAGHTVAGLDAQTFAAVNWPRVDGQLAGRLVRGNVVDPSALDLAAERLPGTPSLGFHLAAESHVDRSLTEPAAAFRANAEGTMVVARWCAAHAVPLVYCSTDEVYGDITDTVWVDSGALEHAPMDPSSPYSAGKASGELAVRAVARSYGLRAVITRGCNAWGPRQVPEKLVPICLRLAQRGEPIPLHGGGRAVRQWIHVEEFADGLVRAGAWLLRQPPGDPLGAVRTFNLAGPTRLTVRDVARMAVLAALGDDAPESDVVALLQEAPERPGQDRAYHLDGWQAERLLGFRAVRELTVAELQALLPAYPPDGPVHLAGFISSGELREQQREGQTPGRVYPPGWWSQDLAPVPEGTVEPPWRWDARRYLERHHPGAVPIDGACTKGPDSARWRLFEAAISMAPADGAVLEFGVAGGVSLRWLAEALAPDVVHGFDSFRGLVEPWEDVEPNNPLGAIPVGTFDRDGNPPDGLPDNVSLHVGTFDLTVGPWMESDPRTVRLVHVDCDTYLGTLACLEPLAASGRLLPGSVLIFDELWNYSAWRDHEWLAWVEVAARHGLAWRVTHYLRCGYQAVVQIVER